MIYKFTLTHAVEGSKVISEPDGWEKSTLGFERHPEFHSLVEYFKSSFQAYGSNGTEDGGRSWLLNVEKLHGQDAEVDILVEIDEDETGSFETLYTGQLAVSMFVESLDTDHMLQMVFTQNGFWTKFISRYKNKVNIKSTVTESGDAVTAASDITLPLPSQVITKKHDSFLNDTAAIIRNQLQNAVDNLYIQVETDTVNLDEVQNKSVVLIGSSSTLIAKWVMLEAGEYTFDFRIEASVYTRTIPNSGNQVPIPPDFASCTVNAAYNPVTEVDFNFKRNNEAVVPFTQTDTSESSVFTLSNTITLNAGDEIFIYGELGTVFTQPSFTDKAALVFHGVNKTVEILRKTPTFDPIGFPDQCVFLPEGMFNTQTVTITIPNSAVSIPTYFKVIAQTVTPQTTTKAFLTHDVMDAITKRITDNESSLYSEYLGNAFTSRVYGVTGCGSLVANAKGLHIRGYTLTEKPFFKSAEEWWQGINPIHNLGLGYEKLAGVDIIRVERKEHFYDDGTPLVNLSNVYSIKRSYDSEHHFNQVEIGYDKWQSQAATGTGTASGIDDPQTKHTYNSRFRRIGKKITLFSKWVAASLTLETTRRVGVLKSSNYTYDDETFVIALRSLGAGSFTPELDENFTTLTNLTNKETRYNSRLTPGRNFLRWANYLNGCLQSYIGSVFKFASGEGNFDMTSLMSTSCLGDGTFVDEKGNFAVTSDFLFIPMPYEINHFMTWDHYKLIRDNKNRCIGISQTEADFKKFFIKSLEYQIGTGLVKLIAWPKEPFDIVVPDFVDDSPTRYYEDFYESQYE